MKNISPFLGVSLYYLCPTTHSVSKKPKKGGQYVCHASSCHFLSSVPTLSVAQCIWERDNK